MNNEEQALIDGLFTRLQQAEKDTGPRDAQAQERIKEHVTAQPAAAYYMAQAILVQEAAIKRLDDTNKQLKAELEQAKAQAQATPAAQQSGGFLSSLFGSGQRDNAPAAPAASASGGGWREPARPSAGQPAPPPSYPQSGYAPPPAAPSAGGGFMRGALQTAAGVAGGVMLAEGISSLFHHNAAPQEIVEVIREEPAPASDHSGWGNDDQQQAVSQEDWGRDNGGFSDADYSNDDGGGFFSDDDTFI